MAMEDKVTTNIGPVTISGRRTVVLNKDGKPLMARDIVPGNSITIDLETGEVREIQRKNGRGLSHGNGR